MISSPRIEVATLNDVEDLAALRTEQGWQQSEALLRALVTYKNGRVFVLREAALHGGKAGSGAPIATTSALAAAPMGIVGNVIVREDYRRRGLGKHLMLATLAWLDDHGVTTILLDATDDGQPLYAKLGFVAEEKSYYATAPIAALRRGELAQRAGGLRVHLAEPRDLSRLAALDAAAFGGGRLDFLALVAHAPHTWLYITEDDGGAASGYLFVRLLEPPYIGIRIGPLIATGDGPASALLLAALDDTAPWRERPDMRDAEAQLVASIATGNPAARAFFEAIGAAIEPDDVVMRRVRTSRETASVASTANAHPEWLYCWLAPMVF